MEVVEQRGNPFVRRTAFITSSVPPGLSRWPPTSIMTFETTLQRLDIFKNSVAVIAWVCLFFYSMYLTVDAYANSRPFTPLHVIIPFVLLLLCIRSSIRLAHRLKARAQA